MNHKYRFSFHYNKPASKMHGLPLLTFHYRNKCHLIEELAIFVPIQSKINKEQPRLVMQGFASEIERIGMKIIVK